MACSDWNDYWNALEAYAFQDAVICSYGDSLTVPLFGALVILGIINLPIYIRQQSVQIPFVLTMVIGGVIVTAVAGLVQTIMVIVVLFVLGLGPVLLLRRVQRA